MPEVRPVRAATPVKKGAREGCKLGDLFRLLGESYVLDILHYTLGASTPRRFVDYQRELRMSPNTLADRLRGLVEAGLLTRTAFNEIPPRVEYAPTEKAKEFEAIFKGLEGWAGRNTLEPLITR